MLFSETEYGIAIQLSLEQPPGVRGASPHHSGKSTYNLESALHVQSSSTSTVPLYLRFCIHTFNQPEIM